MVIYLSHSGNYDYETELYQPLKQSGLIQAHQFFLPHEHDNLATKSKDIIARSNLLIAEVSYPSTGQGIEIGWANAVDIPIVCIYKAGSSYSNSLNFVTDTFIVYRNQPELMTAVNEAINRISK